MLELCLFSTDLSLMMLIKRMLIKKKRVSHTPEYLFHSVMNRLDNSIIQNVHNFSAVWVCPVLINVIVALKFIVLYHTHGRQESNCNAAFVLCCVHLLSRSIWIFFDYFIISQQCSEFSGCDVSRIYFTWIFRLLQSLKCKVHDIVL